VRVTVGWIKEKFGRSQKPRRMVHDFSHVSPSLQQELNAILSRG
jgi:hypothetical protein